MLENSIFLDPVVKASVHGLLHRFGKRIGDSWVDLESVLVSASLHSPPIILPSLSLLSLILFLAK
jgi:hypothetical protein